MKCSDVERVLPELLDGAPASAFQTDVEMHLRSCQACSDLVSDLKLITSESRQLAASDEPASRVWVRIAAELRAEGLIREPEQVSVRPIRMPDTPAGQRWSPWWLAAPVAAALLAAGSYVVSHKAIPQVAIQKAPPVVAPTSPAQNPPLAVQTAAVPQAPTGTSPGATMAMQRSTTLSQPAVVPLMAKSKPNLRTVEPLSSAEDQQFLSVVSTRAPSMRATYESQLQAVNADIRETQAYVNRNPRDADARQHLMDAYEQKALLYQIALDRIQ